MGAESTKANNQIKINLSYEYLYRKYDENYGEVEIYLNKRNQSTKIGIIKKYLKDQENFKEQINSIQIIYQLPHPNLLKIHHFSYSNEEQMCSQYKKLNVVVEYHEQNLEGHIQARKELDQSYSEPEIWYLLKSLCDTLQFLQENGREYKDVHPKNVLINSSGEIKLIESIIQDLPVTNYHKILMGYRNIEYLSPEQLLLIKKKKKIPVNIKQEKVNTFCLGMICVQCITQVPDEMTLNSSYLENQIESAFDKYNFSESLHEIIAETLNYNPLARLSPQEILKKIKSFSSLRIASNLAFQNDQDINVCNKKNNDSGDNGECEVEEYVNERIEMDDDPNYEAEEPVVIKVKTSQVQDLAKSQLKLYEFEMPKQTIHERINEIRKNINTHSYTSKRESEKLSVKRKPSPGKDLQTQLANAQPNYKNLDDNIKMALLKSQAAQSQCYGIRTEKRFSVTHQPLLTESHYLSTKAYQTPEEQVNFEYNRNSLYDKSLLNAISRTEEAIKKSQLITSFHYQSNQ